MDLLNISTKKYIIFGASSGIGRETAIQLSKLGANLVLVGRYVERLEKTKEMLTGDNHIILQCDISDFDSANEVVKTAVAVDGIKLDGCVFSAGIYSMYPISAITEAKTVEIFNTNFMSLVSITKAFSSRRISNDGSSFVSVSSRTGNMPDKAQGIYGATKAAVNAYTIASAKEMSNRGIRFNAVCPELVNTTMSGGFKENAPKDLIKQTYPLGVLEPEDVANAITFLLSDMSTKITGQLIWLSAGNDGGNIQTTNWEKGAPNL